MAAPGPHRSYPQLPVLLRGTADEEGPCPGFVLEEISKISRESAGSSQCLLEFLLGRLRSGSCHVKLKVWHCCGLGAVAELWSGHFTPMLDPQHPVRC